MKTVLVTSIGSFSADCVMKCLGNNGYRVVGTDINPRQLLASADCADVFYNIAKSSEPEKYIKDLREVIKKEQVDYIVPLTDAEIDVLVGKRNELEGACLCLSDDEVLRLLRNKRKCTEAVGVYICQLEEKNEITAGKFSVIPEYGKNQFDSGSVTYPVILKPESGRSSIGLKHLEDKEAVRQALKLTGDYILQPCIQGHVVTVDILIDKNGHSACIAREEYLRTKNGAGLSVRTFYDEELSNICRGLGKYLRVKGCVNFEWIKHGDSYFFLECNPRFSGGIAFSLLAGYDMVKNHMRIFEGTDIKTKFILKSGYMVKRYSEEWTGKQEGSMIE